jgi:TetR/AcrR family fatty acid metabolism transcriptional regulator
MPVISQQRMRDRRATILIAATRIFSHKGYAAASITEIAQAAEVSDGLIYKYFHNKRDLLYHVLRAFYQRSMAQLETKVAAAEGFEQRLQVLVREHLAVFVADADLCRLFISEVRVASDYSGSSIQELNRRYTSVLMDLVRNGVASGDVQPGIDARLVRDMLFGAIEHLAWRHISSHRPLDMARIAGELTSIMLNGMRPAGRGL